MQAVEEINLYHRDICEAFTGQIEALERILNTPVAEINQATAQFLINEATRHLNINPKNHNAITLMGFAKSILKPENANAPDHEAALGCYLQAAEMGNTAAMCCAAHCYAKAQGTAQDTLTAARYFRRALVAQPDNEAIKTAFTTMIRRYYCPPATLYEYYIALKMNIDDKSLTTVRKQYSQYLESLYKDEDPLLTKAIKVQYASIICPHLQDSSILVNAANQTIFIMGMFTCWEIDICDPSKEEFITKKLQTIIGYHETLTANEPQNTNVSALILRDSFELIQAKRLIADLDILNPQAVLEVVELLLSIETCSEPYYLLADLIMKLETDRIFLNHKDKYRLILGLLSKVHENIREQCINFDILLKQSIASLISIQTTYISNDTPDETVYLSFRNLLKLLPDYNNLAIPYSPRLEYELLQSKKAQEQIQKQYGDRPIVTFESLLFKSYADCNEQLNLTYLHNRLLSIFKKRIIPPTPAVVEQKTEEEALVIDSGNAGLGRKRGLMFKNLTVATEVHIHDLAFKVIEYALADFNIPANRAGLYLASFTLQYQAAIKLLNTCKANYNYKEIISAIVDHLESRHRKLTQGTFKYALLQRLVEALNLGNIEKCDKEPDAFCTELCALLKLQCQPRVTPPVQTESNSNNISH